MTIEEIIEQAKEQGDGLKFKAKEGQSVRPDVVFNVVDAWLGFVSYEKKDGGFFQVSQFKNLSETPLVFELVE